MSRLSDRKSTSSRSSWSPALSTMLKEHTNSQQAPLTQAEEAAIFKLYDFLNLELPFTKRYVLPESPQPRLPTSPRAGKRGLASLAAKRLSYQALPAGARSTAAGVWALRSNGHGNTAAALSGAAGNSPAGACAVGMRPA